MDNKTDITPGMQEYVDLSTQYLAERDKYIREVVKSCIRKAMQGSEK